MYVHWLLGGGNDTAVSVGSRHKQSPIEVCSPGERVLLRRKRRRTTGREYRPSTDDLGRAAGEWCTKERASTTNERALASTTPRVLRRARPIWYADDRPG